MTWIFLFGGDSMRIILEMEGVKIASPITMEVPVSVSSNKPILAAQLCSRASFTFKALFSCLLGVASLYVESSLSSA